MANTYTNLIYHIVFSTKNRFPLIHEHLQKDLYCYIGGIIRQLRGALIEIGGMPDHIHLALKMKTDLSLADLLRHIKGGSSRWINERLENKQRFGWQDGYGAFSVSESQLNAVIEYIRNQKEHHREKIFQEEYVEFLKHNHISYDEKYLWN